MSNSQVKFHYIFQPNYIIPDGFCFLYFTGDLSEIDTKQKLTSFIEEKMFKGTCTCILQVASNNSGNKTHFIGRISGSVADGITFDSTVFGDNLIIN